MTFHDRKLHITPISTPIHLHRAPFCPPTTENSVSPLSPSQSTCVVVEEGTDGVNDGYAVGTTLDAELKWPNADVAFHTLFSVSAKDFFSGERGEAAGFLPGG